MFRKEAVMEINEWIVVASRSQAKIFRRTDTSRPLQWVFNLVNEAGRLKNREFETDRPNPRGHSTTMSGGEDSPHEIVMEKFAKQIADAIKVGSDQHTFSKLYVFAEPHLLGRIKQNAPKSLKNVEVEWIGKDLEKATTNEILERVS
jgi:protein required for attachment to host cells